MIQKNTNLLFLALTAGLLLITAAVANAKVNTGVFSNTAIHGYDPVAYFTEGKAIKGDREFTYEWKDVKWRFASQEHLDLFTADPAKYAPQYGGYCAWATSQGYLANGDPKVWTIWEDKLYLNFNEEVKEKWVQDIPGYVKLADENWPELAQ